MISNTPFASSYTAVSHSVPLITLEYNQRLRPLALLDCSGFLWSIPQAIGGFFTHRYADCRMFVRAFGSMFGTTTPGDVDRRVNEIFQFKRALETFGRVPLIPFAGFQLLSSQARNLFFYTDSDYIGQFRTETDPARVETIRREILRECERAICLQQTLAAVNIFYSAITGRLSTSEQRGARTAHPQSVPMPTSSTCDLNIPNTVPYVQDQIPAEIQQRAGEIARLKERFDALPNPPTVPDVYNDPVILGIMTLPVFDASHTEVQNGLAALRAASGRGAAALLNTQRTFRHLLEKDSLEGHITAGTSWSPSKCPTCRHPEHGGIRRENLLIDTGLQKDIERFLRRAVRNNGASR